MWSYCFAGLFLAGLAASAQELTSETITVAAREPVLTRSIDAARFTVYLRVPVATGLSTVLSTLTGLSLSATDLLDVSSDSNASASSPLTTWSFTFDAPIDQIGRKANVLEQLIQRIGSGRDRTSLWYEIALATPTDSSAQACSRPEVVARLRQQAEAWAAVAGVRAGRLQSLSTQPVWSTAGFLGSGGAVVFLPSSRSTILLTSCLLTAEFQLLP